MDRRQFLVGSLISGIAAALPAMRPARAMTQTQGLIRESRCTECIRPIDPLSARKSVPGG